MKVRKSLSSLAIVPLLAMSGTASAAGAWQWSIEPYVMASNIDGTVGVGRVAGVDVNVDTKTILENLRMAFMLHAEGVHESNWGVMLDYGFMKLGSDIAGPLGGITSARVRQGIFEGFVFHRLDQGDADLDIYGGIRWWDNDITVNINPAILPGTISTTIKEDWVDPVVGVRYQKPLNSKWTLVLQGDLGGFGLGSDMTYSAAVGATYRINERTRLDLKYKGLWVDYENGISGTPGYYKYDTVTHGTIAGLIFDF